MEKKKVHLVLGSGGARGIAHIGVIEQLLKDQYEIIEIIGCSMGAVVGGIYATGHLNKYSEWLKSLSKRDVFELMDFTFTRQGFIKGEKLFDKHLEVTGKQHIEDFSIPFTAVATDMRHHEEVHFRSGELYQALRASVSIPGLFVPVVLDNRVMVDGGVLNPLPVNLVKKEEDALVIAVDVNGKAVPKEELTTWKPEKVRKSESDVKKWFENLIPESLEFGRNSDEEEEKQNGAEDFSLLELMDTTFSFTQDRLTELMVRTYPPDILIQVPRNLCNTFDFYKAGPIIEQGIRAYKEVMHENEEAKAQNGKAGRL